MLDNTTSTSAPTPLLRRQRAIDDRSSSSSSRSRSKGRLWRTQEDGLIDAHADDAMLVRASVTKGELAPVGVQHRERRGMGEGRARPSRSAAPGEERDG